MWWGGVHGRGACVAGGCAWQGACVAGGMCGRGPCMVGDMCGRGGMHGRGACMAGGHAWQGACVAGGQCGRGDVHGRVGGACMVGGVWQGVCMPHMPPPTLRDMVGQCAGGTHPTGMYSCFIIFFSGQLSSL